MGFFKTHNIIIPISSESDSEHLQECLESCVNQTLFNDIEIICIIGSNPRFEYSIIQKFEKIVQNININITNSRNKIKFNFTQENIDFAHLLNTEITKTMCKYIYIVYPNQVLHTNAIEIQYKYFLDNPNYDVVVSNNDCTIKNITTKEVISLTNDLTYNYKFGISFKRTIFNNNLLFEQYFNPLYECKFICECINHNKQVYFHQNNINSIIYTTVIDNSRFDKYKLFINRLYNEKKYNNELSVILTFYNEGEEVEKTIQSIRATSLNTTVILIDDFSDDDTDYESLTKKYHDVIYVRNNKREGVANSRNIGVLNAKTEYIMLLDAHMRFYDFDWDERVLRILKQDKYKNCLFTSNSSVIKKHVDTGQYINVDDIKVRNKTYGCTSNLMLKSNKKTFSNEWNYTETKLIDEAEHIYLISNVLGACYFFTKTHWNNINGLTGLVKYGLDEGLMSIKTWMFGGKCCLLYDFYVGHIYRDKFPYKVDNFEIGFNEYLMIKMFITQDTDLYIDKLYNRLSINQKKILNSYIEKYKDVINEQVELVKSKKVIEFNEFKDKINKLIFD